jgi:hypothetical protein
LTKPRIYFAGKIGSNDWRQGIIPTALRSVFSDGDCFTPMEEFFDHSFELDCGGFIYCGPFFIGCDHACYHGPGKHGAVGANSIEDGEEKTPDIESTRDRIFEVNVARLEKADLVFAYIESVDCYGTLIELGQAHRMGKRIAVRLPPEHRAEMWMVERTADCVMNNWWSQDKPADCWEMFCQHYSIPTPGNALLTRSLS